MSDKEIVDNLMHRAAWFENPDYAKTSFPGNLVEPLAAELREAANRIRTLEREKVEPHKLFNCENGSFRIGRRTIHDDTPHQLLSASQIMRKSSNIGMVKVARLIEPETFYRTILRFGVGA